MTKALEYRWPELDKRAWGEGPWVGEPDKVQWTDATTGYPCVIRRSPELGNLCGYVGVPPGHVFYGYAYDDMDAMVEGCYEVNYAAGCGDGDPTRTVCHVPEPGQPDHVWWFGFDCAHGEDYIPGYERDLGRLFLDFGFNRTYKTVDDVKQMCAALARALKEVG